MSRGSRWSAARTPAVGPLGPDPLVHTSAPTCAGDMTLLVPVVREGLFRVR
ncbi:hypothetical protein [Streptomyces sp. NPDC058683]|uniref:hypothetical protein n=1 Tax=Streptomyces sp. NPDC058683 TaxID=3346597 RepID=UPI003647215F